MQRFPLPESARYSYARRFNAQHLGTDILAPLGTPVLAVERGRAWSNNETKGGKVVYLQGESGRRYFYGHLSEWQLRIISATPTTAVEVDAGDELGKVGNTGNAEGGPTHVHFQQRDGSLVIDPYDDLYAVDPHRRGVDTQRSGGIAIMLLLLWWAK